MNKIIALLLWSIAGAACADDAGNTASQGAGTVPAALPVVAQAPTHAGKLVYDKWCGICHGRGERMPGTASLQAKYKDAIPAALEDRSDMAPEFVKFYVRNGVMIMPAFRKTEITDADLEVLTEYLSHKKAP